MLRKMLVHGLIAAAVIGCAAAVYADGRNDGPATDIASPAMRAETGPRTDRDNGYIADSAGHTERNRHLRQAREHQVNNVVGQVVFAAGDEDFGAMECVTTVREW